MFSDASENRAADQGRTLAVGVHRAVCILRVVAVAVHGRTSEAKLGLARPRWSREAARERNCVLI